MQANDFSINGYMITPLLSCDIIDGKVVYSTIYLDTEELKRNGIDSHRYNRMQVCRTQPEHLGYDI